MAISIPVFESSSSTVIAGSGHEILCTVRCESDLFNVIQEVAIIQEYPVIGLRLHCWKLGTAHRAVWCLELVGKPFSTLGANQRGGKLDVGSHHIVDHGSNERNSQ